MIDTSYLLAHSQDLDLIIRHVLAGLGHGLHAGRERGAGVEFSEYRAYAPGDEWRRVDWKLLARNDRYYVREAERDSHVAIWFWLDASASMREASYAYPEVTKLDYARAVLACLAAVAQRQGDAFGLIVANQGRIHLTPVSRGPRQLHRVLAHLNRTKAEKELPDALQIKAQMQFVRAPSLLFVVSDFLDWPSASGESLLRLRRMRHDVRALSLHTEAERNADFPLNTSYCDPEHAEHTAQLTQQIKPAYQAAYAQHFDKIRSELKRADIPYLQANIEQDIAKVVRSWLRLASLR
ncbi:DUF58 domain-containing protein [Undibacterium flavidum]|uniref:DUF58 domain-containing protein n=1 Tax=Undibacterium flavidum TaxID=2762297 RepID=A0ABR6YFF3_9BURK|nr:DUF58 domain-containing protein [Undibacterium flavidum]MBC3875238.1 DUF58 domain-containing protein [Undibacterium flavidum]